MKSLIFVFLSSLLILKSYSQIEWAPENAKWIYEWGNAAGNIGYIEMQYVKDTTVLGKSSNVLNKKQYWWNKFKSEIQITNLGNEITYTEDSVVYLYSNNQFDTLYAFNCAIGNSWILHDCPYGEMCQKEALVTVIDTGRMKINNMNLKYITVQYDFDTLSFGLPYKVYDTIFERIGSTEMYFLPWDIIMSMLDGNEGGKLRCYSDDVLGTFSNDYKMPCNSMVSQKVFPEFIESPTWNIALCDETGCTSNEIYFLKDTTYCNKKYSVVFINGNKVLARTTNQKVYIRETNNCEDKEFLIYDFSVKKGDTIFVAYDLSSTSFMDTIPVMISNIDSIELNDGKHRRFTIEFDPSGGKDFYRQMHWIEGIGSDIHPFYSFAHTDDAKEISYQLMCYFQYGSQLYSNNLFSSCKISSLPANEILCCEIKPNPFSNYFDIFFPGSSEQVSVDVFDLTGMKLFSKEIFSDNPVRIYLNDLNTGFYIVKVHSVNFNHTIKLTKR